MSPKICKEPVGDPTMHVEVTNNSQAHYMCRAGYRPESGDLYRTCAANGTWSGTQPICVVDSVLPKAYLVILIVGATVAVFLACIPYDFYRFRKRKKKVRDHQERLSLVTRIAPGHAKVIVETVPVDAELMAQPHPRRFGFKSLFSVFRFVGGKMKSPHGTVDEPPTTEQPECHAEPLSVSDVGPESEGITASSYAFSSEPTSCNHGNNDVSEIVNIDGPDRDGADGFSNNADGGRRGSPAPIEQAGGLTWESLASPPPVNKASGAVPKKGLLMFQKANEVFGRQLQSRRLTAANDTKRRSPTNDSAAPGASAPAVVEVTCINDTVSLGKEHSTGSVHSSNASTSRVVSPSSSTSSPEMALLRHSEARNATDFRTFDFTREESTVAYHSMPQISDRH